MKTLQKLILIFTLTTGFISCQKEKEIQKSTNEELPSSVSKLRLNANVDYTEFQPISRQPGENFDSYVAYWNGCAIKMTGPGSYNFDKYPNLVNGVPVTAASLTTYDGTSVVNTVNSGPDGNVFEVSQSYLGGVPSISFQGDIKSYFTDLSAWLQGTGSGGQPLIGSYVKETYSGGGSYKTYTGKIIRIAQGSHLAIANINYPLPPSPSGIQPTLNLNVDIVDSSDPTVGYYLHGVNGNFTYAEKGTETPGGLNGSNFIRVQISGSYSHMPNSGVFHYWGTILRTDGTYFNFNITMDLS